MPLAARHPDCPLWRDPRHTLLGLVGSSVPPSLEFLSSNWSTSLQQHPFLHLCPRIGQMSYYHQLKQTNKLQSEDVERLDPSDIAGRDVTGVAAVESSSVVSEPLDIDRLPTRPSNSDPRCTRRPADRSSRQTRVPECSQQPCSQQPDALRLRRGDAFHTKE